MIRNAIWVFVITLLTSCYFEASIQKKAGYKKYFDDETWKLYQTVLNQTGQRDFQKDIQVYTQVIHKSNGRLNKDMPVFLNPYFYRAHAYYSLGQYKKSLDDFDKVLTDTTTMPEIYIERADIFRMLKEPQKALESSNVVLNKLDPKNATALYVRGLTYLSLKDTVSACNDFSESKKAGFDIRAFEEFSSFCR